MADRPSSASPADSPLLIVNADDYGLTEGVSRAILRAHTVGIVTSTSLLTLAPGFDKTVGWLGDVPELGTGAHLAAVGEDPPLLSAREVPTLITKKGALHDSWRQFLPLAAAGRIDPADLRREFAAQLERIAQAGIAIDHLDTHQNLHLWPMVRNVVMELGEAAGVRTIRVTRSAASSIVGRVVAGLASRLEAAADERGWRYPDVTTGLDEAGRLELGAMVGALGRLASLRPRTAELATHPGEPDDSDLARYRWGYQWSDELSALCSNTVRSAVDELGFRIGTFAELGERGA
jgi:predicted glycoside hydrolase/deacetylase ChbG (UPF0249 family)